MKIGMYTENEIFEFMTEEGGFLGRSMYDAIFDKIHALITENEQLKKENKKIKETIQEYNDAGEYIYKLEDNWNKLKEWLEEEIKYDENWYKPECKEYIGQKRYPDDTIDGFNYVLDKMQEIEGGMNE